MRWPDLTEELKGLADGDILQAPWGTVSAFQEDADTLVIVSEEEPAAIDRDWLYAVASHLGVSLTDGQVSSRLIAADPDGRLMYHIRL